MSAAPFVLVPLGIQHDRLAFNSSSEALNRYLQQQATQDVRRRVAACFVAATPNGRIAAYYTLAAASMLLSDLPERLAKQLPRYPSLPAVRMGRLAVDVACCGQGLGLGLGAAMLADALARSAVSDIAALAMLVDAKDDAAAAFYKHHGFTAFADAPRTWFLPLAIVR